MNRWSALLATFLIVIGAGILWISQGVVASVDEHHTEVERLLNAEETTQSIRRQRAARETNPPSFSE